MKRICFVVLFFLTLSIYAQTSLGLATGRIAGSNIPLNNLSKSDFDKIMQGSIFDVYTLELKAADYNTDLKKHTFLETDGGKGYQERLQTLRSRLTSQGIRTILVSNFSPGLTTNSFISSISDYDVKNGGFDLSLNYNEWNKDLMGREIPPGYNTNIVNGFRIPNIKYHVFMPVPANTAQRVEGNRKARIQLQLEAKSFAIQKIFLINEDTNEVYAEMNY